MVTFVIMSFYNKKIEKNKINLLYDSINENDLDIVIASRFMNKEKTKPKLKIETTDAVDVNKGKKIGKKIKLVTKSNY